MLQMLIISEHARVSAQADIEDSVRGSKIVIEAGVVIDAFVKIKPVGGTGDVLIGRNSYVNSGTVIYSGNGVHIGEGVLIAANCTLAPVNHEFRTREATIAQQGFLQSKGGIRIADDVWIGAGCVILDGASIGKGCVIGALSLVKGELEPYGVYAGNPLEKLGERS
jgi:acetyltransferase-like isoleucine patch superfamily enzyme